MKSPRCRILMVSHSSESSGAPRVLMDVASCLAESRYEITFCFPEKSGLALQAIQKGSQVIILKNPQVGFKDVPSVIDKLKILRSRLRFIRECRKGIKTGKYDLVYINSMSSFYAGLAGMGLGIKKIWHVHENLPPCFINRLKWRMAARLSDLVLIASPTNVAPFSHLLLPSTCRLLPNGIRIERFRHARMDTEYNRRFNHQTGDRVVGALSSISHLKGIDVFLRAMILVLRRFPAVKVVIPGDRSKADPEFLKEIDRLSSQPPLKDRVFFPGYCDDTPSFLGSLQIFVHPSRNDSMPLSVLEAMAAGKAIVATDVGYVREMLDAPRAGLVTPPENPQLLAEAVIDLLSDQEKRKKLEKTARAKAERDYSMETFRRNVNRAVNDALSG